MNNNERLAEIISAKLCEKGLIEENNTDFKNKLSRGSLKDIDWKFLLEENIRESESITSENIEDDETE